VAGEFDIMAGEFVEDTVVAGENVLWLEDSRSEDAGGETLPGGLPLRDIGESGADGG
jgi:hypothetical protein